MCIERAYRETVRARDLRAPLAAIIKLFGSPITSHTGIYFFNLQHQSGCRWTMQVWSLGAMCLPSLWHKLFSSSVFECFGIRGEVGWSPCANTICGVTIRRVQVTRPHQGACTRNAPSLRHFFHFRRNFCQRFLGGGATNSARGTNFPPLNHWTLTYTREKVKTGKRVLQNAQVGHAASAGTALRVH